jgi:hypothetical protein
MSMRIFSGFMLMAALSACGGKDEGGANSLAEAEAQSRAKAAENGEIDCAIGGAKDFTRSCIVEREMTGGELILTIRHSDGGFRRFRVIKGQGVVAADGAEPAVVQTIGANAIEVSVGGDRYRLPATVKGAAKR